MNIHENYPLKKLNTFGVEAKAQFFIEIHAKEDLISMLLDDRFSSISKLVLGGGSNILFINDFHGIIIANHLKGIIPIEETADEVVLKVMAGENWHEFVTFCVDNNYGGIENLSLIPGNVGASPMQNIGAYGVEAKDVIETVEAINLSDGATKVFTNADCNFGYRTSIFKQELKDKYFIAEVTFRLSKFPVFKTSYGAIKSELKNLNVEDLNIDVISKAICNIRKSKLPDVKEVGNAGSFFKNPVVSEDEFNNLFSSYPELISYSQPDGSYKIAAAWLIEQCGWKGKRFGDFGVHPNHALILVNYGNAKGEDILKLSSTIADSVIEKFGIKLEREVNIVT